MSNAPDLRRLLVATAKSDRAAFRALYEASSAKLFAVTLRICRDRAVAEDALQDAFVEIWRKAGAYSAERGAPLAWMAVIARNRSIDLVRRRGRGPAWGGGGDEEQALWEEADPRALEDGGAELMALRACLEGLEPSKREMILSAYMEGYSREELAERAKAPVGTIKTWLRRGLAELRQCLGGRSEEQ